VAWVAGVVALVVTLGGVIGFLSGCSGGPEPTPSVTWTPVYESPWPTPMPTPTDFAAVAPVRPAAMDEVSNAGAEAVAVYFLELYPYAYATNDLAEWRALSHPECVFCASVVTNIEEHVAANRRAEGGELTITLVNSLEVDVGEWWTVDVELIESPVRVLDVDGAVVSGQPDTITLHMDLAVIRQEGQWLVREISYTELAREVG